MNQTMETLDGETIVVSENVEQQNEMLQMPKNSASFLIAPCQKLYPNLCVWGPSRIISKKI